MSQYQDHPISEIFPMMSQTEIAELAEDIKTHGLKQDIVIYEGKILDGRNRYRACQIAGVKITTCQYAGDDPTGEVLSLNLHRRHLTESQRAMVGAKWANLKVGVFAGNQHVSPPPIGGHQSATQTRNEAAEKLGIGTSSIDRAKRVIKDNPELVEKIESGEIKVNAAYELTRDAAKKQPESIPETWKVPSVEPDLKKLKLDLADGIWAVAKAQLDKIGKDDASRVKVLNEVIQYCNDRITNNK